MHENVDEWQEDAKIIEKTSQRKQPKRIVLIIKVSKKTLAQNILKNQQFIKKYKNLDAQLQNTMFEYYFNWYRLQSMATMDQMANVMSGMAKIMGNAQNKVKLEQFTNSMKTYTT